MTTGIMPLLTDYDKTAAHVALDLSQGDDCLAFRAALDTDTGQVPGLAVLHTDAQGRHIVHFAANPTGPDDYRDWVCYGLAETSPVILGENLALLAEVAQEDAMWAAYEGGLA